MKGNHLAVLLGASIICMLGLSAKGADGTGTIYDPKLEPNKSFLAARAHLNAGEYEKALAIHEWMFANIESLKPDVFFLTVYNLCYDWHQVALNYPPAMKSLLEHRDRSDAAMRAAAKKKRSPELKDDIYLQIAFREVTAFNEWLEQDAKSADLFAAIEQDNPEYAESLYIWARDALLKAKRFEILVRHERSPESVIRTNTDIYKRMQDKRPDLRKLAERRFIEGITSAIDIYAGAGFPEKAEQIRSSALKIFDSPKIRDHGVAPAPTTKQ